MVVEFDPECLKQFCGPFPGEKARFQVPFEKGEQVLVQAARIEGIPGIELGDHPQVNEPVVLKRLMHGIRRTGRDLPADGCHLAQLCLPVRIRLLPGHAVENLRMPFCVSDQGLCRDLHGPELLPFVIGLGITHEIQPLDGIPDLPDKVQHTRPVNLIPQNSVPGGPLLLKLGKDPGLIGILPLPVQVVEDPFPVGPSPPVGNDHLLECLPRFCIHLKRYLGASVQDVQVLQRVQVDLRIGGRRLGCGAPLTHDQLAGIDADHLVLQQIPEGHCTLHGNGILGG